MSVAAVRCIEQTCYACPSQWEGTLDDGRDFYIRYRWGHLTVEVGNPWWEGEEIYGEQIGDDLDGLIALDRVAELVGLDLSHAEPGRAQQVLP